ncbi:LuxR family transcriptional regulator [cyanobacterium TDX16]|nr:LuxR family transcriptional regulator [cyanobacterium TDX16]
MNSPLLLTKFQIPLRRSALVRRDRLIEQLNRDISSKLILISAPAGFGKTTLLSEWSYQAGIPVGWLSLDETDNDPARFWTYVVTALQQFHRQVGESTLSMLRSTETVSCESCLIPLINDLTDIEDDLALVLDDYHAIASRPIHHALTFLLEHLPPQLHLAIATRTDPPLPLARLRGRDRLTELRAADLRFTIAEATEFIAGSMQLSLSQEQVEIIQARTEGWIAGLQLAAMSMRDAENISLSIESLKGTQRYILDYLVEEVLERQPQPLQSFLLRTSILDRMCGALCEAVMGEDPAIDGTETLAQLEHRNLFIIPLDYDRQWYRYHHLFRELLHHHLKRAEPEQLPRYHRQAREWYEKQGLVTEAIPHAIAAGDFDGAADLIEREVQSTENPRVEAVMLLGWLEALPHELVWTRPWLMLSDAWALYSLGQLEAAVVAVQNLESLLKQQPNSKAANTKMLWGLVTAVKGMQARQQGAMSESIALLEQALQLLPQDNSWMRATILLNLGVTYFHFDDFQPAQRLLPEVAKIGQSRGMADPAIAGLYLQAQFLALRGRMERAIALCQQGVDLAKQRNWLATYAGIMVQVAMGELLRERNQLEEAAGHLTECIERSTQTRQPGAMMGYITLARVRQAQGNSQAARSAIEAAEQLPTWLWPTILSVAACKARLHLAQGNLEEAIAWAEDSGLGVNDELSYSFTQQHPCGSELDYLTLVRVLLARGRAANASQPYLDDAMRLSLRLHDFAQAGGRNARVMETLILQTLVWQAREDKERSLSVLERALQIPHTGDYIRLFVDEGKPMMELLQYAAFKGIHQNYVSCLLAACSSIEGKAYTTVQPLIEPLTDRELEVLRYLATGLSNRAIADKLFVTLAAVKWHARNIYSKLDVGNRTQAVVKARELGILA